MDRASRKPGAPSQRTYFVRGHRVEGMRDDSGTTAWVCDCAEYVRSRSLGDPWCPHAERVAAAASIDRFFGADGLTLRSGSSDR